jgi:pimeloyl-ACP methyl ester carboxylesterase
MANNKVGKFFRYLWLKFFPPKTERLFINKSLTQYEKDHKLLQTKNFQLSYLERGNGPKTIVFLHGMSEEALNWFYTMEYFFIKSNKYRLLALDLPGYGNSTFLQPTMDISIKNYVLALNEFLEEKKIPSVMLVGHSLGAQTAAFFTCAYPDKVNKLVLVASAGIRRFNALSSGLFKSIPMPGTLLKNVSYLDWIKLMTTNSIFLKDINYFKKMMYDMVMTRQNNLTEYFIELNYHKLKKNGLERVNVLKKSMDAMLDSDNYIDDKLPQITAPVCFIWGEKDRMIPIKYGFKGFDLIKHERKKIYVFKKTGHYPLIERPRDFAEVLYKFTEMDDY